MKQARDKRYQRLIEPAGHAQAQKQRLVSDGGGGYTPIPHAIYRNNLPDLVAKHGGQDARDALTIYMYLQAHANGTEENDWYMWAFPSVGQIHRDTGIHGDRIAPLVRILEKEGLLRTDRVPWMGNIKKMYLPYYYPIITDSRIQEVTKPCQ